MSHVRVKTEYQVEGAYGSTEKKILYAHHNNSCDVVTFFDEDGTYFQLKIRWIITVFYFLAWEEN